MNTVAGPAMMIPVPVIWRIDAMKPAGICRRECGVSSPMIFTPFLRRMPAIIIPLTDSIEMQKNREYQIATLGAYPSFRIFLAVRVQNFSVMCIFSCFHIDLKRLAVAAKNFAVIAGFCGNRGLNCDYYGSGCLAGTWQ
jgi:hypothetical protein